MADAAKHIERAEKLIQKGKLTEAIEAYKLALQEDPNSDAVVEIVAELYQRVGQTSTAQECLAYLFDKHMEKADPAKAISIFRKLARLGPPDANRQLVFARLLEKGKPQEAAEQYQQAIRVLQQKGEKTKVAEALLGLSRLDPDNRELQHKLAEAAKDAGQAQTAAAAYLREAQLTSQGPEAKTDEYLPLLEKAYALAPDDRPVALELSRVLLKVGEPARVMDLLKKPLALPDFPAEAVRLFAEAGIAASRFDEAAAVLWRVGPADPEHQDLLIRVAQGYLGTGQAYAAVEMLRRMKTVLARDNKVASLAASMEGIPADLQKSTQYLDFAASLYEELRQDSKLHATLMLLFDLHYAEGNYPQAADLIERVMDLDPYNAENIQRLQRLNGKVDSRRWQSLATRFRSALPASSRGAGVAEDGSEPVDRSAEPLGDPSAFGSPASDSPPAADDDFKSALMSAGASWRGGHEGGGFPSKDAGTTMASPLVSAGNDSGAFTPAGSEGSESTVLEDLVLQAEIFVQYGLKAKAVERLKRAIKLFPGEELRHEKLRQLMGLAGMEVKAASPKAQGAAAAPAEAAEDELDITQVSDITRNIYRQGTVKAVLFTAVNDVGRAWKASKCMASLSTPGKTPSALLEYCATGMKQSDAMSLVKLVHGTMKACADGSALSVEDAEASPALAALQPVIKASSIRSLLAIAMFEGDQQIGVVVLEQCDRRRKWKPKEVTVLKNLVEQMAMAISHVKLRGLMKSLAVTDERTGMLNRGSYVDCLLAETARATKQGGTLSVALLQFGRGAQFVREAGQDNIKKFIEEVGQAMTSHLRPNDVAIRYDSTTLALVMPDTKGQEAMLVMDKLRKLVGGIRLGEKPSPPMSFGVAEPILGNGTEPVDSVTELINRVEDALEGAYKDGVGMGKLLSPAESGSAPA